MQAFLHFSASQADATTLRFMHDIAKHHGQDGLTILSQSDHLGSAGLTKVTSPCDSKALRHKGHEHGVDINLLSGPPQKRKLMLCDMDSTIITSESLDDLSAMAGIGEAVAEITARAMTGALDFREALSLRLAMLKGEPATLLERLISETNAFPGASELVGTMRAHDATCLLVSGGFTFLTSDIAARFGFSDHFANHLALDGDKIAGYAPDPIIDSTAKLRILTEYCDKLGIAPHEVLAMGDGANDIPMLSTAGLGVAWQAKPLVKEHIAIQLSHSTLCGALFLQGFTEKDIT